MRNSKLFYLSLLSASGVFVYVSLVAWFINNAEAIIGKTEGQVGVVIFLLLFVFSALTTSLLVLGKPILLYFEGEKHNAVKLLLYTAGWIFLMFTVLFIIMFSNK
jgi:hypothetical protein